MTFEENVPSVCQYYQAYTLNGTFGEVIAYLEGYCKGEKRPPSDSCVSPFIKWLSEIRHYPPGQFWKLFRNSYPDEATTIAEFSRLWQEYQHLKGIPPINHARKRG